MMDGMYRCDSCSRGEQAFKCVHLEEGTKVVCSDCFYEAQEKLDKLPTLIEDIKDSIRTEKQVNDIRHSFIGEIRKYCMNLNKDISEAMNYFIGKEIEVCNDVIGANRDNLTRNQLIALTQHIRDYELESYFGTRLSVKVLQNTKLKDYYTHRDYESKLKSLMKRT